MLNLALMLVEDVVIFVILVLVCVLVYAVLNARMVVHLAAQCVDGGVILLAVLNVSVCAMICVSIRAQHLVLHLLHLILITLPDLIRNLLRKGIKPQILQIE